MTLVEDEYRAEIAAQARAKQMTMTPQEALKEAIEFFGKWDDAKGQALAEALRKLQNPWNFNMDEAPKDRRLNVRTENEIYTAHWAQNPITGDEAWIVAEWGDEGDQALVKPIAWAYAPTTGENDDAQG